MTRIPVEVIITAIVVVLALSVIFLAGEMSLNRTSKLTTPRHHRIDVLGVRGAAGSGALVVYVMNLGPDGVNDTAALNPEEWLVVIKNSSGEFSSHPSRVDRTFDYPDSRFSKGEVWALICEKLSGGCSESCAVEVFGPNNSQGIYVSRKS